MKIFYPVAMLLFYSCSNTTPNFEKEKMAILQIEKLQREYHFNKNARAFTNLLSDKFIEVGKGSINKPSKKENLEKLARYFNSCEFIRWDDVKEPEIRFSDDASVAYVTIEKMIVLKLTTGNNPPFFDTSHYAWLSIYKKENDAWKIDGVASTSK